MNRAARRAEQRADRRHGRGWTKPTVRESQIRLNAIAEGSIRFLRMFGHTVPADRPARPSSFARLGEQSRPADQAAKSSWWRRAFGRRGVR